MLFIDLSKKWQSKMDYCEFMKRNKKVAEKMMECLACHKKGHVNCTPYRQKDSVYPHRP